jgi:adenylosuccinate lyase
VLDTCYSLQLVAAGKLVQDELEALIAALWVVADNHRMTLCMGRTHGMDAEPVTVGLWLVRHLDAFIRELKRLKAAIKEASVCKISGAVGTYALLPWVVEQKVADKLGLHPANDTSQIISRSHYVPLFQSMGNIMTCVEALAVDIRLKAQSLAMEVQEPFSKGQKGSSAMPHKKNPISCENMGGLARVVRAYAGVAEENVVSWGERDISHSSAERFIGPDATTTTGYALQRLCGVISGMVVYPDRMRANLARSPWWSGRLLDHMIEDHGWNRPDTYGGSGHLTGDTGWRVSRPDAGGDRHAG